MSMQVCSGPKFGISQASAKQQDQEALENQLRQLGTSGTATKYGIPEELVRRDGFSGTAAYIMENGQRLNKSA